MSKTLHNSDISGARQNVKDINVFGNGDLFQLISKASSKAEGWMKSTKAMSIPGAGCVIQVTTQQGDNIAEALTFVPGVTIVGDASNRRIVFIPDCEVTEEPILTVAGLKSWLEPLADDQQIKADIDLII